MFFIPLVMKKAETTERPRPSRPMCSSHSLRCHIRDFGVPGGTVAPGTKMRAMMAMITIGAPVLAAKATDAGTVSSTVKGNLRRKAAVSGVVRGEWPSESGNDGE